MEINKELDTRGLNCPLPILKAKKALSELISGQLLRVARPVMPLYWLSLAIILPTLPDSSS